MINDAQFGDVAYHPEELQKYYSGEWTVDELKKAHAKRVADDAVVRPQAEQPAPTLPPAGASPKEIAAAEKAQKKALAEGKGVASPLVDILPKAPTHEEAKAIARVTAAKTRQDDLRNSQVPGVPGGAIEEPSAEDYKIAKKFQVPTADPVNDPTVSKKAMAEKTADEKAQAKKDQMAKMRAARANKKTEKKPSLKASPKPPPVPKPQTQPVKPTVADDIANSQTRVAPEAAEPDKK